MIKKKKYMDRDKNRSDSYQPYLLETSVCPHIMGDLSLAQGMMYKLQPFGYNEELLDLKEELKKRVWELIEFGLTKRQKEVIKLYVQNKTQNEIAKELGINQTSVHKVIKGNIDYKNQKKRYGGAIKKISKLCKSDEKIQEILKKIQEINECVEL
jgi:RNA polymerase sigma factor (sigma-70 family)